MSRSVRSLFASATLALTALALSGCVSVFPNTKPVQLYELTPELEPAPAPTAPAVRVVNVGMGPIGFEQAAAGDRLLTVRDGEAAYISGARWVSPAATLFDQSLQRAFAEHGGRVRLIPRGEAVSSPLLLNIDVESFRVVYGADGAPSVETTLRARMIRFPERTIVFDRRISLSRKADANRVTAIVKAYDSVMGAALSNLVEATDEAVASS